MAVRQIWLIPITFSMVAMVVVLPGGSLLGQDSPIQQLNQTIQQGQLGDAAQLARQLDEASNEEAGLTLPLARLARSLERAGEIEQSAEFYQRAIVASERENAPDFPPKTLIALRLAAASALLKSKQFSESVAAIAAILETPILATERQQQLAVSI